MSDYLFTSKRIGFRLWREPDLNPFIQLNADPLVMQHFPRVLSPQESEDYMDRLNQHYLKRGHTYYACDLLDNGELIGFIGLAYQEYESSFTPATDIGWRLRRSFWGQGLATEGAKRCVQYAFSDLRLTKLFSTCTLKNTKSEKVMQKIGMQKMDEFRHPRLADYPHLERCVWYEINKDAGVQF